MPTRADLRGVLLVRFLLPCVQHKGACQHQHSSALQEIDVDALDGAAAFTAQPASNHRLCAMSQGNDGSRCRIERHSSGTPSGAFLPGPAPCAQRCGRIRSAASSHHRLCAMSQGVEINDALNGAAAFAAQPARNHRLCAMSPRARRMMRSETRQSGTRQHAGRAQASRAGTH